MIAARTSHLRVRQGHEHARVTFVELFFDLVFVFAVTQLSHGLIEHLTPLGAAHTAILLLAMWWTWIDTAWITNWVDPEKPAVRLMLFALMLAGLVLSASIPRAFEDRALAFAAAYIFMAMARDTFMLWALAISSASRSGTSRPRLSGWPARSSKDRCEWHCGRWPWRSRPPGP